ncbi:hypothetical protein N7478_003589 [Penicillium angulare]|uniref:uncharacterized protein n=1 Tax=Penicillium angulare TaxID=116970 RepID=UPI0025409717|nr:uncharacterized protein N7478_003589 [Penicillium angulare]KAJ5287903.1 hypothetical protein N7478_003589 [Penicillium angulare]
MDAIYNHFEKVAIVLPSTGTSLSKVEYDHVMEPTNGNPLLELMQIFADVGPIFSTMRSIDHSNPEACQLLLLRCWGAKGRLLNWSNERHLGSSLLLECASAEFGDKDIPPTDALFGQPYLFASQDDAVLHLTLWAQLVIVHKLIHHAHSLVTLHTNEDGSPSVDLLEGEDLLLSAQYADMVARGIPYCIQQSMRSSIMHMMAFILSVISTTFSDFRDRDKFDWLQQIFNYSARRGFEYAARLAELARDTWAHQEQSGAEDSYASSSLEMIITQSHDEGSRNEEYLERKHMSFLT